MNAVGVLGNKSNRYYYFPHKSYIEFLCAEYINATDLSRDSYVILLSNINDEILDFVVEGGQDGISKIENGLSYYVGHVNLKLLDVATLADGIGGDIPRQKSKNVHASRQFLHYVYMTKNNIDPDPYLIDRLGSSSSISTLAAAYQCTASRLSAQPNTGLLKALIVSTITGITPENLTSMTTNSNGLTLYHRDSDALRHFCLANSFSFIGNGTKVRVDTDQLASLAATWAKGHFFADIPLQRAKKSLAINLSDLLKSLPERHAEAIKAAASFSTDHQTRFRVRMAGDTHP